MNRRVLVVDDDYHHRRLFCRLVSQEGLQASSVETGTSALAVAKSDPPDLFLIDIALPGISGLTLYHALRRSPITERIPVVLFTGLPVPHEMLEYTARGLHHPDVFNKTDIEAIIGRIRQHFSKVEEMPPTPDHFLLRSGCATLDTLRHTLHLPGFAPLHLGEKRFDVFALLFRQAGPVSHETLLEEVWGRDASPKTAQVTISRLRADLRAIPSVSIVTDAHAYRLLISSPSSSRRLSRRR